LAVTAGISTRNRAHLEELHRLGGAFTVAQAAEVLEIDRAAAARLLGYLARRGWLSRVRRGVYVAVPLDARQSGEWIEDPWIVADKIFSPCYIGGWSACEHWDFTEQVFRALFGTVGVWRGQTRVAVSDPSRTIVDILDDPRLGGGIRTVADVLSEYMGSQHRNDQLLIEYADRLGNRAVFKRLGYLIERLGIEAEALLVACRERRSAGVVALDPSVKARGQIVRRWGLRVNVALRELGDVA
jgi:predicted transcriptional regulator of viral defense system